MLFRSFWLNLAVLLGFCSVFAAFWLSSRLSSSSKNARSDANKISPEKGQYELQRLWEHFASSGLVITDRLHGMIFCAITNTPFIVLNNSNGKVRGVFNEWIKNNYPIAFADSKNDLSAKRNDVISLRSNKGMAKEHFNTIRDSLI